MHMCPGCHKPTHPFCGIEDDSTFKVRCKGDVQSLPRKPTLKEKGGQMEANKRASIAEEDDKVVSEYSKKK